MTFSDLIMLQEMFLPRVRFTRSDAIIIFVELRGQCDKKMFLIFFDPIVAQAKPRHLVSPSRFNG